MQKSFLKQRKIFYLIGIILLLGVAYVHKSMVIDESAKTHDISETNLGKVDLGGSISRFALSSFRGPLVCGLWWEVQKLQEQHDYKQLEIMLTALTKLQPHYKGPWKYQGWNLAYNVSVEFDRVDDKYLYISKGIRWLAQGEEINRIKLYDSNKKDDLVSIGDPEMRSEIAQYISNKMYYADENLMFRPLLHMSCIPADQRDPVTLKNNPSQLARFKLQYPRFVRRVKTYLNIPEGDTTALNNGLITFLTEHQEVPSLWTKNANGSVVVSNDPWPRWPNMANRELLGQVADKEIMQDGLDIAGYWYAFSTEMLPQPKTDLSDDITPEQGKYTRVNKNMHSIIFRAKPAQTQSRSAQELYKEGWCEQARAVSEVAYSKWLELGVQCGMEHSEKTIIQRALEGQSYMEKYKDKADAMLPPPEYLQQQNPKEYEDALKNFRSYLFTSNLSKLRNLCRFDYWVNYNLSAKTPSYNEAMRSKYLAEMRYSDWPISVYHYQRCIGLLQTVLKMRLDQPQEIAMRLSLLNPSLGTIVQQVMPPIDTRVSAYGSNETTQEELLELQDKYMRTQARMLAPEQLRAALFSWKLQQQLVKDYLIMNPMTLPLAALSPIIDSRNMNIDFMEDVLENGRGPFDTIIPSSVREVREKDRLSNRK